MKLLWRIYICFFLTTLLALGVSTWYASYSLRDFYKEQIASELLSRAGILAGEIKDHPVAGDTGEIDRHCKEFARLTQTRVTVILPDGKVIADSDQDPAGMENHRDRPEVTEALKGGTGRSVRYSDTLRRTLMYLAIPLRKDGSIVGVVRTSLPLSVIDWTLRAEYRHIFLGTAIVGIFFALVAYYLSRQLSRPLDDMRATAERLAAGDLKARVSLPDNAEMRSLAGTLNLMAAQLNERLEIITRQSDEQKAVLSSMVEGVLAVDEAGHIMDLNAAAIRLLEIEPDKARGRSIQEAVRNPELQNFIASTLASGQSAETEIVLYGNEEHFLQLHSTPLKNAAGKKLGALLVLHDITRLKQLETVRRDFVANASHELKTPITALKGCVETLSDPVRDPADDARFLAMMKRQVDRLGATVEDLLSLSRLEHDTEHKRITLEPGSIADLLRKTVQIFDDASKAKSITLSLECTDTLTSTFNPPLLEQAVGNLVDNAIKYSGENTRITLNGTRTADGIEIRVSDQGPGIEKKHLSRIFERFYRVDQARSRSLGGTGLGLAIVKHVALAHGGSVSVSSTPGQGSAFTIRLPG